MVELNIAATGNQLLLSNHNMNKAQFVLDNRYSKQDSKPVLPRIHSAQLRPLAQYIAHKQYKSHHKEPVSLCIEGVKSLNQPVLVNELYRHRQA